MTSSIKPTSLLRTQSKSLKKIHGQFLHAKAERGSKLLALFNSEELNKQQFSRLKTQGFSKQIGGSDSNTRLRSNSSKSLFKNAHSLSRQQICLRQKKVNKHEFSFKPLSKKQIIKNRTLKSMTNTNVEHEKREIILKAIADMNKKNPSMNIRDELKKLKIVEKSNKANTTSFLMQENSTLENHSSIKRKLDYDKVISETINNTSLAFSFQKESILVDEAISTEPLQNIQSQFIKMEKIQMEKTIRKQLRQQYQSKLNQKSKVFERQCEEKSKLFIENQLKIKIKQIEGKELQNKIHQKNVLNQVRAIEQLSVPEVHTIEREKRQPSVKQNKKRQQNKLSVQVNSKLNKEQSFKSQMISSEDKNTRNKSKYENIDDSILNEIEEIRLTSDAKHSPEKRYSPKNVSIEEQNSKLNRSFENKKGKDPSQTTRSDKNVRKLLAKQKFDQMNKNDNMLISIGEILGYCSTTLKKSKLQWRIPSLLFYRYCYDSFREFQAIYVESLELGLIKKEQLIQFESDNAALKNKLIKICKAAEKKGVYTEQFQQLAQSEQNIKNKLPLIIRRQVLLFIKSLMNSNEKNDMNALTCGLRMINSVFVLEKLSKDPNIEIIEAIEEIPQEHVQMVFDQWQKKFFQYKFT